MMWCKFVHGWCCALRGYLTFPAPGLSRHIKLSEQKYFTSQLTLVAPRSLGKFFMIKGVWVVGFCGSWCKRLIMRPEGVGPHMRIPNVSKV